MSKEMNTNIKRNVWICLNCKEYWIAIKRPNQCKECGYGSFAETDSKNAKYALNSHG